MSQFLLGAIMTLLAILALVFLLLLMSGALLDFVFFGLGALKGLVEPTKSPFLRRTGLVIAIGGPLLICVSLVLLGAGIVTEVRAFFEVATILFAFSAITMFAGGLVLTVWKACVAAFLQDPTDDEPRM